MEIARLGEQALVQRVVDILSATLPPKSNVLIGIGDDAALVRAPDAHQILKTDHLVEGVHFQKSWAPPEDLGWKALAVNISDVAALGGTPDAALVALALPPQTEVEWVDGFYRGIDEAARRFGISLVGGETSAAPFIVISIFLTGVPPLDERGRPHPLLRSAGHEGDVIAVTGTVGAAAAGLRLLQIGHDDHANAALRKAHLRPEPRVETGLLLAREGIQTAIDVSDGLVADLERLCLASNLAADLHTEALPLHPAAKRCFPDDALKLALAGGEDYEILFAGPLDTVRRVQARSTVPITIVGELVRGLPGQVHILTFDGKEVHLKSSGWRHF